MHSSGRLPAQTANMLGQQQQGVQQWQFLRGEQDYYGVCEADTKPCSDAQAAGCRIESVCNCQLSDRILFVRWWAAVQLPARLYCTEELQAVMQMALYRHCHGRAGQSRYPISAVERQICDGSVCNGGKEHCSLMVLGHRRCAVVTG
jgi:hypothetical protein